MSNAWHEFDDPFCVGPARRLLLSSWDGRDLSLLVDVDAWIMRADDWNIDDHVTLMMGHGGTFAAEAAAMTMVADINAIVASDATWADPPVAVMLYQAACERTSFDGPRLIMDPRVGIVAEWERTTPNGQRWKTDRVIVSSHSDTSPREFVRVFAARMAMQLRRARGTVTP